MARTPGSVGEAMLMAMSQADIDARNQAYAVATQITQNRTLGTLGETVQFWSGLVDIVHLKIRSDMEAILKKNK